MSPGGDPADVTVARAWFVAEPRSIADARRFVLDSIGSVEPGLPEAILLVVSELASNALRHGATGPYTVVVERFTEGFRVTVTDGGTGEPAPLEPGVDALSGRGLQIVEAVSDAWGVSRTPGVPGKSVWSELRCPR